MLRATSLIVKENNEQGIDTSGLWQELSKSWLNSVIIDNENQVNGILANDNTANEPEIND